MSVPELQISSNELDFAIVECGLGKSLFFCLENVKEVTCEFNISPQMTLSKRKKEGRRDEMDTFRVSQVNGVLRKNQKVIIRVDFEPKEERRFDQSFVITLKESCKRLDLKCSGRGEFVKLEFSPKEIDFGNSLPCSENYKRLEIRNYGRFDAKLVLNDLDQRLQAEYQRVLGADTTSGSPYISFEIEQDSSGQQSKLQKPVESLVESIPTFERSETHITEGAPIPPKTAANPNSHPNFGVPKSVEAKIQAKERDENLMESIVEAEKSNDFNTLNNLLLEKISRGMETDNLEQSKLLVRLAREVDSRSSRSVLEFDSLGKEEDQPGKLRETDSKVLVLVVGYHKETGTHLARFLSKVQNRAYLEIGNLLDWNTRNGFKEADEINLAFKEYQEGKFGNKVKKDFIFPILDK